MFWAHPIKGGGGVVEGRSKASGLGEVFDLMLAPANFPLSHVLHREISGRYNFLCHIL